MSDTTEHPFNIRAELARIDRDRAETQKFAAEQRKLIAEAMKMDRDRFLSPILAMIGIVGGIVTVAHLIWVGH